MGSIHGTVEKISATIPVVDFDKWHNGNRKEDRFEVAKQLTDACRDVGFVYIVNHGLSDALLNEAFHMTKKLFDLSHEDKMRAPHPDGAAVHRGYSHPGLEKISQYMGEDDEVVEELRQVEDCKESYEIGSEENTDQPNIWLPEEILPGFKDFTTRFYWECHKLARSIIRAIALGIGLDDPEYLVEFFTGYNNQLRLLHYPSVPAAELENKTKERMPAHSDWSCITFLFQDDCGGLEVEDPQNPGSFTPATPMPGACVMNVGDLLMRWSNDYLRSTKHRVTLPPLSDRFEGEQRMTRERYSIPYFVSPDPDATVECLLACTDANNLPKYEPTTQRAYNEMRAKVQYR